MNFTGLWINKENNEIIKLTKFNHLDDYTLEYDFDGLNFKSSEIVSIYNSNEKHALLISPKKFGRNDIIILGINNFQIGEMMFEKKDEKLY